MANKRVTKVKQQELKLVEVKGQKLLTTSLVIAELFGRPHHNVLKSLDRLVGEVKFNSTSYFDVQGKEQRMYLLDEEAFLVAMPFIGGKKSIEGQRRLVSEYMRIKKILSAPDRAPAVQLKKDTGKALNDFIKGLKKLNGEEALPYHYSNEASFCNRALTGVWGKLDESTLDTYDNKLLAAIREHNKLLMAKYPKQEDRRGLMDEFVSDYRIKHVRLALAV